MDEILREIEFSPIYGKMLAMTNSPSWQAKFFNAYFRKFIRARSWGKDENAVARRARKLFSSPKLARWWGTRNLSIETIKNEKVWGEWLNPKNAKDAVVFYIHGGGFLAGSAASHRPLTGAFANLGNFKIFSVNYRLAPEHRFPTAVDDTFAAYLWLLEQGVKPNKIAIAGDSAGGGLVLSTLLRIFDEKLPLPGCGVCFSPWTDLAATGESAKLNAEKDDMFHPGNSSEFASAYLGNASTFERYASPVFADYDSSFPPILFQVGSTECLLDDSKRIYEKLGGESRLEVYEEVPHCWQMLNFFVPEARLALKNAVEFIDRHLKIR